MGYDGLISREEVLAGLPGGRARTLLAAIEHHTVQLAERSRWALAAFLTRETDRAPRVDFLDTFRRIHRAGVLPTTADLERYAPLWQHLVPVDPKVLAAVSHLLGGKYGLAPDSTPQIRQALRWDTPAVQQAYEELYQRPLQRLFAPSPPPREQPDRPSPAPWLASAVLRDIEAELQSVHLAAGDVLFRQGDVADSLYIVIHGRLQVAAGEGQGGQILREVGPGESIGATTVLAEELHATTAYAVRDTALARLSKAAFDRLVEHHPRAAMQIVRTVMARGGRSSRSTGRMTNTVVGVAVVPTGPDVPLSAFAGCLAAALGEYGPTLHLTAEQLDAALERGMAQAPVDDARNSLIAAWLGEQETTYRYIVYEADRTPSHWTRRCLRQADRILLVGMGESDPAPGEIEAELARMPRTGRQELILLHRDGPPGPAGARGWLARRRVAAHHHVRPAVPEDVRRLARRLTGRALGLVLGGGGARGWAHVGVIRAFEEAGIPIDLIGGSSMGALIGGAYASGMDYRAIVRAAEEFASPRRLFDYTLPLVSLFASRKLTAMLRAIYRDAQIEDLPRPYFCVSSSLTRAQPVVHRQGPLWQAVRASVSIAGVFTPVAHEGDLLIDGGHIDNLPIDAMRELADEGPVVAVNVSPAGEVAEEYSYGPSLSGWRVLARRLRPFAEPLPAPPIAATLLRAAALSSVYRLATTRHLADLIISPPVASFGMLDFPAYQRIIEIGYEAACREIDAWKGAGCLP